MTTLDPSTGRPLPSDAIQRVLFISSQPVHTYQIPPLTSTKGFSASAWTGLPRPTAQEIFTARLRVIETSYGQTIKADIVLEDPKTGDLFAAAPYTTEAAVQQALDSSRFFAVRVVGEGGMRATLGIGFEERSEAFDFSIALGDVRKVLGLDAAGQGAKAIPKGAKPAVQEPRKDFSLKQGETIHVELGGRGRRVRESSANQASAGANNTALFSIQPPPTGASGSMPVLVPPPSAGHLEAQKSPSRNGKTQAEEFGFDDGEFGEFQ